MLSAPEQSRAIHKKELARGPVTPHASRSRWSMNHADFWVMPISFDNSCC
jgi:hypothetical protein